VLYKSTVSINQSINQSLFCSNFGSLLNLLYLHSILQLESFRTVVITLGMEKTGMLELPGGETFRIQYTYSVRDGQTDRQIPCLSYRTAYIGRAICLVSLSRRSENTN